MHVHGSGGEKNLENHFMFDISTDPEVFCSGGVEWLIRCLMEGERPFLEFEGPPPKLNPKSLSTFVTMKQYFGHIQNRSLTFKFS